MTFPTTTPPPEPQPERCIRAEMDDDIDLIDRESERRELAYESHLMDMAQRGF